MAASELTGNPARAKLADYTLALARAQLREHGIRRPPDREALLAAYLDWQRAPEPEPRLCARETNSSPGARPIDPSPLDPKTPDTLASLAGSIDVHQRRAAAFSPIQQSEPMVWDRSTLPVFREAGN